ncbi:universal stress protein [Ascidiimonas aurantiaca]|uniref:universal stress protein n=1 Tax=Ascidiimonas aurantiaca TaxID=1685432 RepID=UPI0030EB798C
MNTVLFATDYSRNSAAGLRYACVLCKKLESKLVITHIFPESRISKTREDFPEDGVSVFEEHQKSLINFFKLTVNDPMTIENNTFGISIEPELHSSVFKGILKKAGHMQSGIIIVGMRGKNSLKNLFMGNVTQNLFERSSYPVLAVPSNYKMNTLDTIVYASNYQEEDFYCLKKLVEIAGPFGAKIRVVHIASGSDVTTRERTHWFQWRFQQRINYENVLFDVIRSQDVYERLRLYLNDVDAGMLAMLFKKDEDVWKYLFQKKLIKRMQANVNIPLLSFNVSGRLHT